MTDPTLEQRETLGHALCRHHAKHRIIGKGVVLHHLNESEEVSCDSCRAAVNALSPVLADRLAAAKAEVLQQAATDPALRLSGHSGISITRLRALADQIEASR